MTACRPNAPRALHAADFAGGRAWPVAPGVNTPCRLVVGRLVGALVRPAAGERVLLDLPAFPAPVLAAFDGGQLFKVLDDD